MIFVNFVTEFNPGHTELSEFELPRFYCIYGHNTFLVIVLFTLKPFWKQQKIVRGRKPTIKISDEPRFRQSWGKRVMGIPGHNKIRGLPCTNNYPHSARPHFAWFHSLLWRIDSYICVKGIAGTLVGPMSWMKGIPSRLACENSRFSSLLATGTFRRESLKQRGARRNGCFRRYQQVFFLWRLQPCSKD